MTFSRHLCVALLAMALFSGCGPQGPSEGTLSGNITINGKVYDGSIELIALNSKTGKGSVTAIQKDGTYSFDERLVVGEYTVYVAPSSPPEASTQAVAVKIDKSIPEEYWNEASPLKANIKEGENKIDFKIPQE